MKDLDEEANDWKKSLESIAFHILIPFKPEITNLSVRRSKT